MYIHMRHLSWTNLENISEQDIQSRTILLDIDGVLMADGENMIRPEILPYAAQLVAHNDVFLVSNSYRDHRCEHAAATLNTPWVKTPYKKPNTKILRHIDYDQTKPLLVIGDKFFTDGLFAQYLKAEGFLIQDRLVSKKDSFLAVLAYTFDDVASSVLRRVYSR